MVNNKCNELINAIQSNSETVKFLLQNANKNEKKTIFKSKR